ncbi:MAG: cobalamin biosynthesis protein CbiX, partial [Curvibacter sp.]
MSTPATSRGLILFAHGSRDPQWRAPMEAVAARAAALD